jgi:hypothetical protein
METFDQPLRLVSLRCAKGIAEDRRRETLKHSGLQQPRKLQQSSLGSRRHPRWSWSDCYKRYNSVYSTRPWTAAGASIFRVTGLLTYSYATSHGPAALGCHVHNVL